MTQWLRFSYEPREVWTNDIAYSGLRLLLGCDAFSHHNQEYARDRVFCQWMQVVPPHRSEGMHSVFGLFFNPPRTDLHSPCHRLNTSRVWKGLSQKDRSFDDERIILLSFSSSCECHA